MEIVIVDSAATAGALAADAIARLVDRRPDAVLGLATGSSPLAVYRELGARVEAGTTSLARARAFLLDEYVGLPTDDPQNYRSVIQREFVDAVDIPSENVVGLSGLADDLPRACVDYEGQIRAAGGVDLQLLGVGSDGHIAFNEPGSSLGSRTRVKTLTEQTRRDNARFFGGDIDRVPRLCLTQGVGTILEARHLVLLAAGERKAQAVRQLAEGPVTARWPASALQLHPHVTVLVDDAAASMLELADYHRETYAGKPDWQEL